MHAFFLRRSLGLVLLLGAAAPAAASPFVCGRDVRVSTTVVRPDHPLERRPGDLPAGVTTGSQATGITLQPGPGLAANTEALAAWQGAVDIWESVLGDSVSVLIAGDLAPLGEGILGATDFRLFADTYDVIRDAMAADAGAGEGIAGLTPTSAQLTVLTTPLTAFNGEMIAAKANLRALGFDMSFDDPEPDGTITFNSDFTGLFDFDPSDGITPGTYDFEAICVHEIGHALGFYSILDLVDTFASLGLPGGFYLTPMDLFRLRPGDGAVDFTGSPRLLADGTAEPDQVLHEGSDLAMSTGANVGDGYQASHWKADEVSGTFLGMMDPTLAPGDRQELQPNDLRVFGLIGWDVVAGPQVAVPDAAPSGAIGLRAARNPFRGRVDLVLRLASPAPVRVDILDVRGRRVARLTDTVLPAGAHDVRWNGADSRGRAMPAGVYYARLTAGADTRSVKLVRLD